MFVHSPLSPCHFDFHVLPQSRQYLCQLSNRDKLVGIADIIRLAVLALRQHREQPRDGIGDIAECPLPCPIALDFNIPAIHNVLHK